MLSRVYNFLDVEREGVLTLEDFERLTPTKYNPGFDGPATPEVVDKFRDWAYEKFGGLRGLWDAIIDLNASGERAATEDLEGGIDFYPFHKTLNKLGWKGAPGEIFTLLNDHKPKTPYITIDDFMLIDWLYISQIETFKTWIVAKHGSTQKAFKAID